MAGHFAGSSGLICATVGFAGGGVIVERGAAFLPASGLRFAGRAAAAISGSLKSRGRFGSSGASPLLAAVLLPAALLAAVLPVAALSPGAGAVARPLALAGGAAGAGAGRDDGAGCVGARSELVGWAGTSVCAATSG